MFVVVRVRGDSDGGSTRVVIVVIVGREVFVVVDVVEVFLDVFLDVVKVTGMIGIVDVVVIDVTGTFRVLLLRTPTGLLGLHGP